MQGSKRFETASHARQLLEGGGVKVSHVPTHPSALKQSGLCVEALQQPCINAQTFIDMPQTMNITQDKRGLSDEGCHLLHTSITFNPELNARGAKQP